MLECKCFCLYKPVKFRLMFIGGILVWLHVVPCWYWRVAMLANEASSSSALQLTDNPRPQFNFQSLFISLSVFCSCFISLKKCLSKKFQDNLLLKPFFPCMMHKLCANQLQLITKSQWVGTCGFTDVTFCSVVSLMILVCSSINQG